MKVSEAKAGFAAGRITGVVISGARQVGLWQVRLLVGDERADYLQTKSGDRRVLRSLDSAVGLVRQLGWRGSVTVY